MIGKAAIRRDMLPTMFVACTSIVAFLMSEKQHAIETCAHASTRRLESSTLIGPYDGGRLQAKRSAPWPGTVSDRRTRRTVKDDRRSSPAYREMNTGVDHDTRFSHL